MAKKPKQNKPKENCRCGAFCIEHTATTGRVCKLEKQRESNELRDALASLLAMK